MSGFDLELLLDGLKGCMVAQVLDLSSNALRDPASDLTLVVGVF